MVTLKSQQSLYLDGIFSSYHIGAVKLEPEFYKYIELNINVQSEEIDFIDDSKR